MTEYRYFAGKIRRFASPYAEYNWVIQRYKKFPFYQWEDEYVWKREGDEQTCPNYEKMMKVVNQLEKQRKTLIYEK